MGSFTGSWGSSSSYVNIGGCNTYGTYYCEINRSGTSTSASCKVAVRLYIPGGDEMYWYAYWSCGGKSGTLTINERYTQTIPQNGNRRVEADFILTNLDLSAGNKTLVINLSRENDVGSIGSYYITGQYGVSVPYEAASYTITLNKGTGINTVTPATTNTGDYGTSFTANTTVLTGYNFSGWYNVNDQRVYTSQEITFTIMGNMTLTAKGSEKTYTVTYNANGGNSTSIPSSQTKKYFSSLTLSSTKPTRNSVTANEYCVTFNYNNGNSNTTQYNSYTNTYSFLNWNKNSGGTGTSYDSGSTFSTNADTTLYAIWSTSTTHSSITLPTPTRNYYSFTGWYNSSGNKVGNGGDNYTPPSNITLYAHWTPINYLITLIGANSTTTVSATNVNGYTFGSVSKDPIEENLGQVTYNANGGTGSINSQDIIKTYTYTFTNWNTKIDGTGLSYISGSTYYPTADITFYAIFNELSSIATVQIAENTFSRTNYSFVNWNTSANGTGISYSPETYVSIPVDLYAIWSLNAYIASFNSLGATSYPNQSCIIGESITLPGKYESGKTYSSDTDGPVLASTIPGVIKYQNNTGIPNGSYTINASTRYSNWIANNNLYNFNSNISLSQDTEFTVNGPITLYTYPTLALNSLATYSPSNGKFLYWMPTSGGTLDTNKNVITNSSTLNLKPIIEQCVLTQESNTSTTITFSISYYCTDGTTKSPISYSYRVKNGNWESCSNEVIISDKQPSTEYEYQARIEIEGSDNSTIYLVSDITKIATSGPIYSDMKYKVNTTAILEIDTTSASITEKGITSDNGAIKYAND